MEENQISRRRHPRIPVKAQVEFFVDADIVAAETEDISSSGLRITTRNSVKTFLRVTNEDGSVREYEAEMVWARRDLGEGMTFGLRFVDLEQGKVPSVTF